MLPFPDRGRAGPGPTDDSGLDDLVDAELAVAGLKALGGGQYRMRFDATAAGDPSLMGLMLHKKFPGDAALVDAMIGFEAPLGASTLLLAMAGMYREPQAPLFWQALMPKIVGDETRRPYECDVASAQEEVTDVLDQQPTEWKHAVAWLFHLVDQSDGPPHIDLSIGSGRPDDPHHVARQVIAPAMLRTAWELAGARAPRVGGLRLFNLGYAAVLVRDLCALLASRLVPDAAPGVKVFLARDGEPAILIARIRRQPSPPPSGARVKSSRTPRPRP